WRMFPRRWAAYASAGGTCKGRLEMPCRLRRSDDPARVRLTLAQRDQGPDHGFRLVGSEDYRELGNKPLVGRHLDRDAGEGLYDGTGSVLCEISAWSSFTVS